jgi:hypothetical protein
LKDAVIEIERRWSAQGLDGREILGALAHVYGLLADLVLDAHKMLNQCQCIFDQGGHPDFRSVYHRTGTLECMVAGVEQRTQRFGLSTLEELRFAVESESSQELIFESAIRYGFGESGELSAWRQSDPCTIADNVLYRAQRILRKDKSHQWMMFIRDGQGDWYQSALVAADRMEKYVLMRQLAEFVERRGCDALIEVGECWMGSSRQFSASVRSSSSAAAASREALLVGVYTREGFGRTLVTPFRRGPFGGIKMDESHQLHGKRLMHLEPIFKVWRKQGFKISEDGSVVRRLWEPDPLDVCFCGGPRRFIECCMQAVDRLTQQRGADDAPGDLSFSETAEQRARAELAQYVIWVRRHTAPTMNAAPTLYRKFVDLDVPAIHAIVQGLALVQKANGTDDALVHQLRHISQTIGVPDVSARLIGLASEWFFRQGRIEEGILELDRLGNLSDVHDSFVLTTAARFCDLDTRFREEMLRRAASGALCDAERWAAQLALANCLLDRSAKEEALSLADAIIDEVGASDGSAGALAEARLLRWRITQAQCDFSATMTALDQDPECGRLAAILIDQGKYDEAELCLASLVSDGNVTAKLLIVDARLRSGKLDEARGLFKSIDTPTSEQLQHPYGVAAALVALSLDDEEIRCRAIAVLRGLPAAVVESNNGVQALLAALEAPTWGKQY